MPRVRRFNRLDAQKAAPGLLRDIDLSEENLGWICLENKFASPVRSSHYLRKVLKMMSKVVSAVVASIVLAGPVLAQDAADPAVAPEAAVTAPVAVPDAGAGVAVVAPEGYVLTELGTVTADQLKGVNIYDAEDASVAEIADLEIGADNMVTGVITDVGGFLGMGKHRILLSADQISIYKNADDDLRAYVSLTKDQLKELPEYEAPNQ